MIRLKKNRTVNRNLNLGTIEIDESGTKAHLRGYGWIMVYRFVDQDGHMIYLGNSFEDKLLKTLWRSPRNVGRVKSLIES